MQKQDSASKAAEEDNRHNVQSIHKNVIRFKELTPNWDAFPEHSSPAWQHALYRYIDAKGSNLGLSVPAAISDGEFRLAMVLIQPGRGAPLHNHSGQELMFAVTSTWQIFLEEHEEEKVILEPWDAFLVPPGIWRGYRNVGNELGCFLNITSRDDRMTKH